MKIVEFEITKKELCEIVSDWWREHHYESLNLDVESFDSDQLETISFRAVDS